MPFEDDSIDSIKREIKTILLSDRYVDVLAAIGNYTTFTDAAVSDHERTRVPVDFPSCELIAVSCDPASGDDAPDGFRYDNAIDLLLTADGKDEGAITRHLQALVLAARRVLKESGALLPTCGPILMGRELYAALQTPPHAPRSFVKSAVLRVTVPTYADQVSS